MSETNFLIGRGELLTYDIKGPKSVPGKTEVYTLDQAKAALVPQAATTAAALVALPDGACPGGLVVTKIALHPTYIAKSFFPSALLRAAGMTSVGSRAADLPLRSAGRLKKPRPTATTEIFAAGNKNDIQRLATILEAVQPGAQEAEDLKRIERIAPMAGPDRLVADGKDAGDVFEAVVHLLPEPAGSSVQSSFAMWAAGLGFTVRHDLALSAGGLWFVPLRGDPSHLSTLAEHSFLRALRPISRLRSLRPFTRVGLPGVACNVPAGPPVSLEPRVAILDGGLPPEHPVGMWVKGYRLMDPAARDALDGPAHGLAVTSAFLFGPIEPNGTTARPYAPVDNLRVFDHLSAEEDPFDMYRSLGLIEEVLLSRQYEFINLSVGPAVPLTDSDIHPWTSLIDELLSDGATLMTISAGNNGLGDRVVRNDRIQVPADCVNALSVGSASSTGVLWSRAPYSATGPGRSPGVVKPDVVAFGGAAPTYFHALEPSRALMLAPMQGTSFSAPAVLRVAVGIRALLGAQVSALAIKALVIHAAENNGLASSEVGWGRVPDDVMPLITCGSGMARVVYQGELKPGKYLRAELPLPGVMLPGACHLTATFCYASPVDPQDAPAYTRAGLVVTFRPDKRATSKTALAKSSPFFSAKAFATEHHQRAGMGKWETVLHAADTIEGGSLHKPAFDIHYNSRAYGGRAAGAPKIPYALVLTIRASQHPNLYADILAAHAGVLVPIQPVVSVPAQGRP